MDMRPDALPAAGSGVSGTPATPLCRCADPGTASRPLGHPLRSPRSAAPCLRLRRVPWCVLQWQGAEELALGQAAQRRWAFFSGLL